jgi:GTP-binding protein
MVDIDQSTSLLFADIPGLIEGASEGKGLGDDFLRHVERTSVLLHLIDSYDEDVVRSYKTIQNELKTYSVDLTKRPVMVVLSKIDGQPAEVIEAKKAALQKVLPKSTPLFAISAQSHTGVKELLFAVQKVVAKQRVVTAKKAAAVLPVIRLDKEEGWRVEKTVKGFVVSGQKIESFAVRTDFGNSYAIARLRDILKKMGIMKELGRQGAEPGDTVTIGTNKAHQIEY